MIWRAVKRAPMGLREVWAGWRGGLQTVPARELARRYADENRAMRERCALIEAKNLELAADLFRLRTDHADLISAVAQYRAANQDLWSQLTALGEAHATRNAALRDYLLTQAAETWGVIQARAASGRVH